MWEELAVSLLWQHANPENALDPKPHPAEPRYGANGKWACHVCRGTVNDGGKPIAMTAVPGLDVFAAPRSADPDQPGLNVEGS